MSSEGRGIKAQIVMEIELPEGSELDEAWYVTAHLEGSRLRRDEVVSVEAVAPTEASQKEGRSGE